MYALQQNVFNTNGAVRVHTVLRLLFVLQHANHWYHESNGRTYVLRDELIFGLSEEESHALQRVSANALQAMNLGVPVVIPRGTHCHTLE